MNVNQAIKSTMDLSSFVFKSYIGDFTDAEMMLRPGPGCNHSIWQLGHLISSEVSLLESVAPGKSIKLPEGFAAKYNKETATIDDASKFHTKTELLELFDKVRSASEAALAASSEADLDAPSPENFRAMFPTVGVMFNLIATHPLMHAGQIVPLRRKLGKPILI